jgi:hypothetical protein
MVFDWQSHKFSNSDHGYWLQESTFMPIHFFASSLLHHHFFRSVDIGTTSWTTRPLYQNLERRTQGDSYFLAILSIFVLPWPPFTFCIFASHFLNRLNGKATYIGSLAPGLDGLVHRLGIGTKGSRKTWQLFYECPHFSFVDSVAAALLNITTCLPTTGTFAPLLNSPFFSWSWH